MGLKNLFSPNDPQKRYNYYLKSIKASSIGVCIKRVKKAFIIFFALHRNDWGALIIVDDRFVKSGQKYCRGLDIAFFL